MFIGDVLATPALLRRLMEMQGVSCIDALFNPNDKINVPMSVLMYEALADLHGLSRHADIVSNPSLQQGWRAASLLGDINRCLLSVFDKTMDLKDQLAHLSCLGHLLAYLYAKTCKRTKFMPSMLYHDLQALVKNAFITSAKFMLEYPGELLYLF